MEAELLKAEAGRGGSGYLKIPLENKFAGEKEKYLVNEKCDYATLSLFTKN